MFEVRKDGLRNTGGYVDNIKTKKIGYGTLKDECWECGKPTKKEWNKFFEWLEQARWWYWIIALFMGWFILTWGGL